MTALPGRALVKTDAGYVHVRCAGEDDGAAILLLHQSPLSSRMWEDVVPHLAPLPVLAPDLLGHGHSDRPPAPLELSHHADLLLQAANEIHPGQKIVVGSHVGAALAVQLAIDHPETLTGCVLLGYPLYRDWEDRYARFVYLNPLDLDAEGTALHDLWCTIQKAFVAEVPAHARLSELADRVSCGRIWYETYVSMFTTDLRALLSSASEQQLAWLILSPEQDTLAEYVDEVAHILSAPVTRLPGGVRVTWEHPEAVAAEIRRFALTDRPS